MKAFRRMVIGGALDDITADLGGFWRSLAGESQLRWLGPEKGVIHLALAAVINAVWDLYGKAEGKPLWKLLVDMTPAQLVSCIPFRYISDALTPEEAVNILERNLPRGGTVRARPRCCIGRLSCLHDLGGDGWDTRTTKCAGWCHEGLAGLDPFQDERWAATREEDRRRARLCGRRSDQNASS